MPNFDLDTSDGRTAWLEARRRGVGASDIAAILGRSSWKTAYHVYHEKLGSWVQADNPRMRWGRKLEDLVAQEYAELTGRFVFRPEETLLRSKAYPWMFASLDRLVHEVEDRSCLGREIILECKTAAEDRGDGLHTQLNKLDSVWAFRVGGDDDDADDDDVPRAARFIALGRDPASEQDSLLLGTPGFQNDGDNEPTGLYISNGDTSVRGLLGTPRNLERAHWFVTQQHGLNQVWRIVRTEEDEDHDRD